MSDYSYSLLQELKEEMKYSPLKTMEEKKPTRTVLADGYFRGTKEQTMYMTKAFQNRKRNLIIKIIVAIGFLAFIVWAIIDLGYFDLSSITL